MDNLEKEKDYIYSIDFNQILKKMEDYSGWLKDDALKTCHQYRNYLFLKKKYFDVPLPPSLDIDLFWHEHILDTKKYIEDTHIIFGRYLHHYPYFGMDGHYTADDAAKCFQMTQDLYFKEFGEKLYPTRSRFPRALYSWMYKFKSFM